jgi:uncharacterized membrane protein
MRGTIIGFDPDGNTGAISGEDGGRYDFVRLEWRGAIEPSRGSAVDFVPDGMQARQIYAVTPGGGPAGNPAEGDTAKLIYILYLASLIVGITGIVGVIMAYVNRGGSPAWVETHYRFQIRTFWIGLLYGLISLITAFILIGFLFALFTLVGWIVRCAKGLQRLGRGEPYQNAATWLW